MQLEDSLEELSGKTKDLHDCKESMLELNQTIKELHQKINLLKDELSSKNRLVEALEKQSDNNSSKVHEYISVIGDLLAGHAEKQAQKKRILKRPKVDT